MTNHGIQIAIPMGNPVVGYFVVVAAAASLVDLIVELAGQKIDFGKIVGALIELSGAVASVVGTAEVE